MTDSLNLTSVAVEEWSEISFSIGTYMGYNNTAVSAAPVGLGLVGPCFRTSNVLQGEPAGYFSHLSSPDSPIVYNSLARSFSVNYE